VLSNAQPQHPRRPSIQHETFDTATKFGFFAFWHCQHHRHDGDQYHEKVEGERDDGRLADRQVVLPTLEGDNAFEPVNRRQDWR
jgi:hypothetical protein